MVSLRDLYLDSRYHRRMIRLMILGFLASGPLHGFELRRHIERLYGHARQISDGSLYPAIKRLMKDGLITGQLEAGQRAAQRRVLTLTPSGKDQLLHLLRTASGPDITDLDRFIVVLAFLSLLPARDEQIAVLTRRLSFLQRPGSFFADGDQPLYQRDMEDPYRRGIFVIAKAANQAEREWLVRVIEDVSQEQVPYGSAAGK